MFSPICIGSCLLVAGLVEQQEKERLKSDIIEQGELSGTLIYTNTELIFCFTMKSLLPQKVAQSW